MHVCVVFIFFLVFMINTHTFMVPNIRESITLYRISDTHVLVTIMKMNEVNS